MNSPRPYQRVGRFDEMPADEAKVLLEAMDRLTDEEWEACTCGPCPLHPAAPAPQDQFVTTLPQEAFDAFAEACEAAPAPSDGLREALTDDDLMIFIQKRLANELRVAGWHDAAEYLIDDYMGQQIIRAMTDCRNARAALAKIAQEGGV